MDQDRRNQGFLGLVLGRVRDADLAVDAAHFAHVRSGGGVGGLARHIARRRLPEQEPPHSRLDVAHRDGRQRLRHNAARELDVEQALADVGAEAQVVLFPRQHRLTLD